MENELMHYGTPRHSGRYPWGSGDDPYQRNTSFIGYIKELQDQGLSEVEIAKGLGMTTSELRAKKSIAKSELRAANAAEAYRLKEKGWSNTAIAERMGVNESNVRSWLDPSYKVRADSNKATAEALKKSFENSNSIDVGAGVERYMGVSRTKLKTGIDILKEEGYNVYYVPVEQLGTSKKTYIMTLAKPGVTYSDVIKNKSEIKSVNEYSDDGGRSFLGLEPIRSVDSSRVQVRYAEQGGKDKDGVIELRRGVEDISLGDARYAQVRIGVDGTHYLKGMAMYSDDIPKGVDIIFNTNKHEGTPKEKVFKEMKDDPDNPFGATVRQRHYIDSNGNDQLSSLNIVNEEGDWGNWSKSLSSQMLSKQRPELAKKQLGLAYDIKKDEFDEINSLTNPAVKQKLMESFADDCDSAAVHLKAAALPRQASHVILPFPSMPETEIYAPGYRDGERVVLIRYPHGGTFEIPELTVNNKNQKAKSLIKNAKDAVGINPKVAERLSGADFDGDTVLVIPNNEGSIKTTSPLKGLKDFDPKEAYPAYEGMKKMSSKTKQQKMGDVSNLITDMTIKGATQDEICRAVRHSMVVIDAEKHNLNYKQSYIDNGIAELKKKYQGSERSGASTLISRSSSQTRVGTRKEITNKNIMTDQEKRVYESGRKVYRYTNETYTTKDGKVKPRLVKSTKMAEVDDAYSLSSGTVMENVYASHANKLKELGARARKISREVDYTPYSPSAKVTYSKEVETLKAKLNVALKNAPLERKAQLLANKIVSVKKEANPNMDAADIKKIKGQALAEARVRIGAKKQRIEITDKEWEAIQAGAVSTNTLKQILNNTDLDDVKKLATPRSDKGLTPAKLSKAKTLLSNGLTQAEVADAIGVSVSTLSKELN